MQISLNGCEHLNLFMRYTDAKLLQCVLTCSVSIYTISTIWTPYRFYIIVYIDETLLVQNKMEAMSCQCKVERGQCQVSRAFKSFDENDPPCPIIILFDRLYQMLERVWGFQCNANLNMAFVEKLEWEWCQLLRHHHQDSPRFIANILRCIKCDVCDDDYIQADVCDDDYRQALVVRVC